MNGDFDTQFYIKSRIIRDSVPPPSVTRTFFYVYELFLFFFGQATY